MLQIEIDQTYDSFFANENAELSAQLTDLLNKTCNYQLSLANYLHMLSYMEFLGARTLVNMLAVEETSTNIRHAYEEIRHSNFLKSVAENLKSKKMSYSNPDDMYCFYATDSYMKRLMAFVHLYLLKKMSAENLSQKSMYRLLVSYVAGVLEKRTIWWYEHLIKAIQESNQPDKNHLVRALEKIVLDEKSHIQACDDGMMLDSEGSVDDLKLILQKEKNLFSRFLKEQHNYFDSIEFKAKNFQI